MVKVQPWFSALHWSFVEFMSLTQDSSLMSCDGSTHWAAESLPCFVQGQWAPQQKPRALAAAASPSFWLICKVVLYSKQWVEAITQWPKWLLFLYIFKIFHSIVLRDSHYPPFLPASFLCLPNDMTKKEWVRMFLLDNSFLNRQTDKAWNRNHVAFRLHRSKVLISVSEDRVNH